MKYLGKITMMQIRGGLKAAGGTEAEVDCFANALQARIEQLRKAGRESLGNSRSRLLGRLWPLALSSSANGVDVGEIARTARCEFRGYEIFAEMKFAVKPLTGSITAFNAPFPCGVKIRHWEYREEYRSRADHARSEKSCRGR